MRSPPEPFSPPFLHALVLVYPEDAHLMKHGQLGQRDGDQGHKVDHKMDGVILCIEAGEKEPARVEMEREWERVQKQVDSVVSFVTHLLQTHIMMGKMVRNFLVAVNCAPSSICSQCVRVRVTPWSPGSHGVPFNRCRNTNIA